MKEQNKNAKTKIIKKIIIGLIISCMLIASCFVAFNWNKINPAVSSFLGISKTETISTTESIQENTEKPKEAKSKKKKKKNKKKKETQPVIYTYVLNTNTRRFHYDYCQYVDTIAEHNKEIIQGDEETREYIIERGFKPCQVCLP